MTTPIAMRLDRSGGGGVLDRDAAPSPTSRTVDRRAAARRHRGDAPRARPVNGAGCRRKAPVTPSGTRAGDTRPRSRPRNSTMAAALLRCVARTRRGRPPPTRREPAARVTVSTRREPAHAAAQLREGDDHGGASRALAGRRSDTGDAERRPRRSRYRRRQSDEEAAPMTPTPRHWRAGAEAPMRRRGRCAGCGPATNVENVCGSRSPRRRRRPRPARTSGTPARSGDHPRPPPPRTTRARSRTLRCTRSRRCRTDAERAGERARRGCSRPCRACAARRAAKTRGAACRCGLRRSRAQTPVARAYRRRHRRLELGGEHVGPDLLGRSAAACRRRCGPSPRNSTRSAWLAATGSWVRPSRSTGRARGSPPRGAPAPRARCASRGCRSARRRRPDRAPWRGRGRSPTRCCWPPAELVRAMAGGGRSGRATRSSPSMRAFSIAVGRRPSRSNGSRMLPCASRVGTRLKRLEHEAHAASALDR